MPVLSSLQSKYADKNVQFVGIAIDTADNVITFSRQFPVVYRLLVLGTLGAELARSLGNSSLALPYTAVFDSNGEALMTKLGRISEPELDALLQKTIRG